MLINTLRNVVAAQVDDFFEDETLLYYLNRSKRNLISRFIQIEEVSDRTLRALDGLRTDHVVDAFQLSFEEEGGYFIASVNFPTADEIDQFSYLEYNNSIPLIELPPRNVINLRRSNIYPTPMEGYYQILTNSFKVYLHKEPEENETLVIYYIKKPQLIDDTDEDINDIPERFKNAVIYSAANMMLLQEGVQNPESMARSFEEKYEKEIETSVY